MAGSWKKMKERRIQRGGGDKGAGKQGIGIVGIMEWGYYSRVVDKGRRGREGHTGQGRRCIR